MSYYPEISEQELQEAIADDARLYELLATPLHEGLYSYGSFEFLDQLTDGQQLLLTYDYLKGQVEQGGFIQAFHNGYVGLLPEMPRQLHMIGVADMATVIDEALKLFVQHHEQLLVEISPQEFAKLYLSLPAFAPLDRRFSELTADMEEKLLEYARKNIGEFIHITA